VLNPEDFQIVVVPPWENAQDDHWMSHWQRKYPQIKRVEQSDWNNPQVSVWVDTLGEFIARQVKPVVIAAHSLGAVTFTRWASSGGKVKGALLVAPPDLEQPGTPEEIVEFGPMPMEELGFPSMLVASENDPYISLERAQFFADKWGSEFVNIGKAGHINPKSGFGAWAEGERLLTRLVEMLPAEAAKSV
jgi:predicted alpha/beta hydrolase family esterase